LFASPSTCGAESFSYYRSMAWIDSAKKIRRKSWKQLFRHFQYEKPYPANGEENAGYLLVSAVFLFTALSHVRTTV
jgi:hypothetical protein